jgi:hypothetical protein
MDSLRAASGAAALEDGYPLRVATDESFVFGYFQGKDAVMLRQSHDRILRNPKLVERRIPFWGFLETQAARYQQDQ